MKIIYKYINTLFAFCVIIFRDVNSDQEAKMSSLLNCAIDKEKSKKLTVIMMLLFCTLPIVINSVCLVPLYASLYSNAAFEASPVLVILKYVQEFFDLTAFAVPYALIIFSALLVSKKRVGLAILIYTATFALRIPLRLVMNIALYGTLGTSAQITVDIIYLAVYFCLEMLQLLIVYIFAVTDANKYLYHVELNSSKKKSRNTVVEHSSPILPFSKIFNWYNPLQRTATKMSLLIVFMKVITRILNDIGIGAPETFGEVMEMILGYASDFLFGIVAYIISLIVFNVVYDRLKIKKTDEDNSSSVL